ncbi:hypothetical protein AVEN_60378-1 [Araneus ventricosus]|uniref:RNase H type-1 domain-containing protein n=1 Tax=Araneus ventricosus TaxID=182803 RepID=A0A4Y2H3W3_ARAVE|nr:hypothetical protein AVEN_60378-1 [Araneus ventricosus]
MALEFISTIGPWNKISLYTDSLSVLEALNTFRTRKQEILAIKSDILEMSKEKSITLHWIPAHTGIQGNEAADSYAKKATTRPNIEKIPKKSFKQLKNAISNVQIQIWQERWASSTTENVRHTEKLIPAVSIHTKKFSHFIVQFLSGHALIDICIDDIHGRVYADTVATRSIVGESMFNLLRERGIDSQKMEITMALADGSRTTMESYTAQVSIDIEGRTVPIDMLALPKAKGN